MANPRPVGSSNIFRQQAPSAGNSLQSSESMADFNSGGTQPCQDSNPLVAMIRTPASFIEHGRPSSNSFFSPWVKPERSVKASQSGQLIPSAPIKYPTSKYRPPSSSQQQGRNGQ
ncbi:hypothetical protein ACLOJK_027048 [Asimina triloba]